MSNRWYSRFSLRRLLVVVTLCGLSLGLWRGYIQPYRAQRDAADQLLADGAQLQMRPANVPGWLTRFFDQSLFQDVVAVKLEHARLQPADLVVLGDLPHVERLYLAGSTIDDEGLRHVRHLRRLRRISLWKTQITDQGLAVLATLPQLEVIDAHTTPLSEACLRPFCGSPNLQRLVHSFAVGDEGLACLASMPALRDLRVHAARVTDAGLARLPGKAEVLGIVLSSPSVTERGLRHIAAIPFLRRLSTRGVPLTDAALPHLDAATDLEWLELENSKVSFGGVTRWAADDIDWLWVEHHDTVHRITRQPGWNVEDAWRMTLFMPLAAEDAPHLARLKRLKSLTLRAPGCDDSVLEGLRGLTRLESLTVSLKLTDAGLETIGSLRGLTSLRIEGQVDVTPAGLEHLASLEKLESLEIRSAGLQDDQLAFLRRLPRLRTLELAGNRLTGAGMVHLTGLQELQTLSLSFNPALDDTGLAPLAKLQNLRQLSAQQVGVTDAGLRHLRQMHQLRSLDLLGAPVSAQAMRRLREQLRVRRAPRETDWGVWMP